MINNYLQPTEFRLNVKRLPKTEFFSQKVSIPGISLSPVEQTTPLNNVYHSGDDVTFNELSTTFIIDEYMKNFIEVYDWIYQLGFPTKTDEYKQILRSDDGLYSDIILTIMNSNVNPAIELHFTNCFPISLSDVSFDTTMSDNTAPESTVSFRYDYYSIRVLQK